MNGYRTRFYLVAGQGYSRGRKRHIRPTRTAVKAHLVVATIGLIRLRTWSGGSTVLVSTMALERDSLLYPGLISLNSLFSQVNSMRLVYDIDPRT